MDLSPQEAASDLKRALLDLGISPEYAEIAAMAKTLLTNPELTVEQVASRLGVAPATLYRYLPGGRGGLDALGE